MLLAIATFLTCLEASGILLGFDLLTAPDKWPAALPFALGTMAILVTHEIGHGLMAQRRDVKLSWPFLIPTWEIGSFGALTRIESVLPNRAVLFDVALAGPAAGGLLSFGLLIVGFVLSHPGSEFQLPVAFFQGSALVGNWLVGADHYRAQLIARRSVRWRSHCAGNLWPQNGWSGDRHHRGATGDRLFSQSSSTVLGGTDFVFAAPARAAGH